MYALVSVMPDYPLRRLTADVAHSTIALVLSLPRNMVEEESDESMFWLEHLLMVGLDPTLTAQAKALLDKCDQVTALSVTSIKTVRRRIAAARKR